ncbi:SDR family NAD(P)-dependent oxidoreductase [Streptomyces sp. NPDC020742]|uniref:SDR family oxidoreductase n=1 Tax=unclassified Streptomyces TaxID=2593676 RepID=UPI0033EC10C3
MATGQSERTAPDAADRSGAGRSGAADPGGARRPLSGSVALVTGASSGIGAATALALAGEGCSVALVARRADRLARLTAAIEEQGSGTAVAVAADLSDAEQPGRTVATAVDRLGRLDILVNNAGFGARSSVQDSDPADWQRMVDLNLTAVLRMSHAALPHLLRAAEGPRGVADLVNVSSVAGRVPRKDNSVYSATKHAVCSFSEALRQEVTARGVRVGLVEPGMTTTEMTLGAGQVGAAHGLPQDVWLRPEDLARAILFMITQPARAAVNEITVRPTAQER